MTKKGIFCLEGLWEDDLKKPSTIQPLLAFLKQNTEIPYIYRDCATAHELNFYLSKFTQERYKDYPILYLAFHGEPGQLSISRKENYLILDFGEFLDGKCKGKIILLGSCSVLDMDKRFLKRFLNDSGALAVMGYTNSVDWMRSSAFEMLLLLVLQENVFNGHGIKSITEKCSQLARSFKNKDKEKDIQFRMVSTVDL
jgi:hypothetical protein